MHLKDITKNFLGYSKEAKSFIVLSILDGFVQWAFWFTLMLYLYHLDMSLVSIGFIAAIGAFTAATCYIPAGYVADKFGRKKILIVGVALAAAGVWLFLLKPHIVLFAAASILNGFAMAIMQPAQNAFISETTDRTKRKYLFCLTAFSRQAGAAVSLFTVILAIVILTDMGTPTTTIFQFFYLTYFMVYVIKLILCIMIPEKYDHKRSWAWIVPKSWPIMIKFGIANLIIGIGAGIMVPWFPLFFKMKFETTLITLAVVFLINSIVWAGCVLIIPLFADKFGSVKTITVAQSLAIGVILIIPNSPFFLMAAAFFIIRIVLMNIAVPITNAFQLNLVKSDERATLSGFLFATWLIAQGTGTLIGGKLFSGNLSIPFYVTASIYVIYIVAFWLMFHKLEKKGGAACISEKV